MAKRGFRACCWIVVVLSAGLWGLSEAKWLTWYSPSGTVYTSCLKGTMTVAVSLNNPNPPGSIAGLNVEGRGMLSRVHRQWIPLARWKGGLKGTVLPLWLPIGLSLAGLIATGRCRSPSEGCAKCGYDISATTLSVCPECGTKMQP